jgi:predicted LPLAT superfamily acyltransferase
MREKGMTKESSVHWSQQNEQAAGYWQLKFILVLFRVFPLIILRFIAFPVGFFYFLFSKRGKVESRRFLQKIASLIEDPVLVKKCRSRFGPLRHIISFSLSLVEKLQSWSGRFAFKYIFFQDDDVGELTRELEEGKGAFLIFSHLGNATLLQGLLNLGRTGVSRKIPFTAIMDMKVNPHFSRILDELNPNSKLDIIGSDEIGSHTVVLLEERINAGGLVLIAGDRTSIGGKNLKIPFLGREAPFPLGIFYLPTMIKAPVYFIFGLRRKDLTLCPKYNMHVHKYPLVFNNSRKERFTQCSHLAESFTALLEKYCKKHPFQWYNFHDFWQDGA